jgi:Domain of unknown function (DUF4258)
MAEYRYTRHALNNMRDRGIMMEEVEQALLHPETTFPGDYGTTIHQVERKSDDGTRRLLKVVVNYNQDPPAVVTVLWELNLSRRGRRR